MGTFVSPHRNLYVPPIRPDGLPLVDNSTILGRLNRSPSEVLYDFKPGTPTPAKPEHIAPAAAGDLRCDSCAGGGSWGTTGMYDIERKTLCWQCAVKQLGLGGLPGTEQSETLTPFLRKPRK